jgi:hypothetical protein
MYVTQLLYNRKSSDFNVGRIFYWREEPFRIRTLGDTNMKYGQQLSLKFQILTALQLIVISCDGLVRYHSGYVLVLLHTISSSSDAIRAKISRYLLYILSQVNDKKYQKLSTWFLSMRSIRVYYLD